MREQADFLNHVADVPPQPDRVPGGGRAVLDQHFAFARLKQPVDQLQRRGFARAAAPEQHQRLASARYEVQVMEKLARTVQTIGDVAEFDGNIVGGGRRIGRVGDRH